jgi:TonB family protein
MSRLGVAVALSAVAHAGVAAAVLASRSAEPWPVLSVDLTREAARTADATAGAGPSAPADRASAAGEATSARVRRPPPGRAGPSRVGDRREQEPAVGARPAAAVEAPGVDSTAHPAEEPAPPAAVPDVPAALPGPAVPAPDAHRASAPDDPSAGAPQAAVRLEPSPGRPAPVPAEDPPGVVWEPPAASKTPPGAGGADAVIAAHGPGAPTTGPTSPVGGPASPEASGRDLAAARRRGAIDAAGGARAAEDSARRPAGARTGAAARGDAGGAGTDPAAAPAGAPGAAAAGGAGGSIVGRATPEEGRDDPSARYTAYLQRWRDRIQAALGYPPAARRRGVAGTVHLEITVDPGGRLREARVVRSAHPLLDEAALESVRGLGPEPFPPGLPPRTLRVRLPVVFALQ